MTDIGKFCEYHAAGGGKGGEGGTKFLKFSGGKQKGGITIFDLNLVGGKTWRKLSNYLGTGHSNYRIVGRGFLSPSIL